MRYATCELCGKHFWSSLGEGTRIVMMCNGDWEKEWEICGECQDSFEAFEQERKMKDGESKSDT